MSRKNNKPDVQLGELAEYSDTYNPNFLQSIERAESRYATFGDTLPFVGVDVWTSFELSWLNTHGVPQVAIAEFYVDYDSDNIIESKSFKYYLNSFNQTIFSSQQAVEQCLANDLSLAANGSVKVVISSVDTEYVSAKMPGECVDQLDCELTQYQADPSLLQLCDSGQSVENQALYSHLLKSNCPVTDQPDWATIWIEYSGRKILPQSFLSYVVSYRQHQDFHETCVEKIFADIMDRCAPESLSVYARYTRRGGLDINPFRTNCGRSIPFGRTSRQ